MVQRAGANKREATVVAMMQALFAAGASIDIKDNEHKTPLHWEATMGAAPRVLRMLLEHGADSSNLSGAAAEVVNNANTETQT